MEFLDDDGLVALWGDIETYVGNETSLDPDGGLERTQDGTSAKLSPTGGIVSTQDGLAISPAQQSAGAIDGALLELTAKSKPATQESTTGKNLLPNNATSKTINGVTFTVNADGSVTANGTATANAVLNLFAFVLTIPAGTYVLSSGTNGARAYVEIAGTGATNGGNRTIVLENDKQATSAGVVVLSGATVSNLTFYPQLELGSTATPYEPYTGGAPSPSPDYAQPIVTVRGRNLWDESKNVDGEFATLNGATTNPNYGHSDYIAVKPNTTYYVSNVVGSTSQVTAIVYDSSKSYLRGASIQGQAIASGAIDFGENAAYVRINYRDISSNHQLTEGSTPQPYVPYGHVGLERRDSQGTLLSTTPIPLPPRGWVAGLPDGTADELSVDGAGKVVWDCKTDETTTAATDGITGTVGEDVMSTTGQIADGATVLYKHSTTEDCGYIDLPDMQDCVLSIPELDALGVRYTIGDGAEIARQWYQRASEELGDAIVDLAAEVTTHEGRITTTERRLEALQSLRKGADGYYVNETVTSWLARKFDGKIYGYSEPKTTATAVTKTGANAGLPNPILGTLTERGKSVYRDIGPTQWYAAKGYVDSDGVPHVKVIRGVDSQEEWDACTDNVWSLRPVVYYSVDESGVSVNGQLSDTWHAGMKPNPRAYLPDGTMRPYMLAARHALAFEGGVGVSKPGLKGYGRNVSHDSLITLLDYADTGYSGKTEYEQWYDNFMLRIIYGTKNSQGIMMGCASYDLHYHPTVAETGVKRVILSNANAAKLLVGSTMMMGNQATASDDRNNANCYNVFDGLVISSIETYDSANKAVYLDTEDTFDTDPAYLLSTAPWHTGSCGDMDWDGTPTAAGKTSGKEPMFFQGCELMNGNYEVLGDVILSSDGETGWIPYVNEDTKNEATSVTSDYVSCMTSLPVDNSGSWKYPLYLSERNGLMYGIQTGGSQTVGVCDGHYTNKRAATGLIEWLSLGSLSVGGNAGLACVGGGSGLGSALWDVWSRLSGVGRSKLSA